ncbi:Uncharacterized protein BM_BM13251 [Brugia malayi]|uniref:Uncharacterized protein n=1 Tax=Brugia malayi TaxID=6279 RepID=A0A4E9EU96_BRUMA|nr:Uncharacterized protein BM_BM13251 [Brugia malayi]VIO87337.1 Uncharacterized protein BM_BM13251 [Brugia malayi]
MQFSVRLLVEYCGASSAYFLRTLAPLDINIEIHLFNQGTIGGRLTTIQMPYSDQKRIFEAGGSVLHPANLYFKNWMENFGKATKQYTVDAIVMALSSHLAKLIRQWRRLTGSVSGLYSVNGSNKLIVEKLMDFSKVKLIRRLYVQNTGYCLRMNDMLTAVIVCSNRQIPPVDDYEGNESSPKTGSNKIWKLFSSFISGLSRMQEIFRIAKNICFVNAVEWLASTVGMSAIGNHNCVDMLLRDFGLVDVNKTTKMEL